MADGEIILYTTDDGATRIQLRTLDGTVWLAQAGIADLFQTTKQNVSLHVRNVLADGELEAGATVKESLTVQTEGGRAVQRAITVYRLEMILAVGYRVRSPRAAQFRRWASTVLQEYLVKGFVMNDERLKDPGFDYFDELLARIRDIRASEARFYQKVRDILALSPDYEAGRTDVQLFYATIQNKMLYAVTARTAAELIVSRADPDAPNMGLATWKGARGVRKGDVTVAKNYLAEPEIKELNLIVTMFLDTAELRASRRQQILLAEWETILDRFLASNELSVLRNAGGISAAEAERIVHERYARFDDARNAAAAAVDDLGELKKIADVASGAKANARKKKPKTDKDEA
jgi:hypothetical protein